MNKTKRTFIGALAALTIFAGAATAGYQLGAQTASAAEPAVAVETNADLHAAYMRGYRTGSRDGMKAQPAETTAPSYEDGYAAGRDEGYAAGYYDGEQDVLTGMVIDTDGDGDSALIYYKGDCYLHGINGYPLDTDCSMDYIFPID